MSVSFQSEVSFEVADVRLNPNTQELTLEPPNLACKVDVITHSHVGVPFVNQGRNPLLVAAALAHNLHYPLTLCPDTIWLTISSGLAQHIELYPEECRRYFVDFEGQVELHHFDTFCDYPSAALNFAEQLSCRISKDASELLNPNFSTTDHNALIAQSMVMMGALKNYFKYTFTMVCGIPKINLLGTTSDWLQIAERVERLAEFGLERWSNALKPVMRQFVEASKGNVDVEFWRGLYKEYRRGNYTGGCGRPKTEPPAVTGWIGLFFPYIYSGLPNFQLYTGDKDIFFEEYPFGEEERQLIDWDFVNDYFTLYTNKIETFPDGLTEAPVNMDHQEVIFIGGLLGVAQDPISKSVRPIPGWAVGKQPAPPPPLFQRKADLVLPQSYGFGEPLKINFNR